MYHFINSQCFQKSVIAIFIALHPFKAGNSCMWRWRKCSAYHCENERDAFHLLIGWKWLLWKIIIIKKSFVPPFTLQKYISSKLVRRPKHAILGNKNTCEHIHHYKSSSLGGLEEQNIHVNGTVPLLIFTQTHTQIPVLVLCMSHIVPELYLSSCARDPETPKEGAKGGTQLSFSCKS